MSYLKSFNENLGSEVTAKEFLEKHKKALPRLSDNLLKKLEKLVFGTKWLINPLLYGTTISRGHWSDDVYRKMVISECPDEWFLVSITGYRSHENISEFYICDQFEEAFNLIKNELDYI